MNEKEILLEKLNKDIGLVLQWLGGVAIDEVWIRKESKHEHQALSMEQVPKCNIETVLGILEATAKYMRLQEKNKSATSSPVPTDAATEGLVEALRFYANPDNYADGTPGNLIGTGDGDRWETDLGNIAKNALAAHVHTDGRMTEKAGE